MTDVTARWTIGVPMRVLLAALSAGAGAIHIAMVSSHAEEWPLEGVAFAVVGALQIIFALLVLVRPSAHLLRAACLANVGLIALWIVSRVSGFPIGPDEGIPHDAAFVDVTAVILETLVVLLGYELLTRPGRAARSATSARLVAGLGTGAVLVVTAAAITSPSAAHHAHGEHAHDDGTPDHAHPDDGTTLDGHGAHDDAQLAFLFPDGDDLGWAQVNNGMNEHGGHGAAVPLDELHPRTRARLIHQLALTQEAVELYPTVADAEAAGYRRTGEFNPGLGVHYSGAGAPDLDGVMSDDEIRRPSTLIFDGSRSDSPLAGFMYLTSSMSGEQPEGFAGPNDFWHAHQGVCIRFVAGGEINALDGGLTEQECRERGATYVDVTTSMVHVWTVPAYTNPVGVFAEANPALRCPDLTYEFSAACQRK
jgi:hypothetical protein